ncbi:MAG: DNA repair protein RecO [Lachnospiraceae bacterium]|nr:DNA repair protein RecO [Lachnospiraceae bacterium]
MTDLTVLKGLIIKVEPFGEYDRRIVMLTDDRGKISAFAKGARRTNSKLVAGTNLFCFGEFALYSGRNAYSINDVKVINYFSFLRDDFESAYYGMYFAEIADYYCHENLNDKDMLTLLYQSLRALESKRFDNRLVKAVYEIKAVSLQGEFGGVRDNAKYSPDTLYALDYIIKTSPVKLFSFEVKDEILNQLVSIGKDTVRYNIDIPLKSAEILDTI